MKRIIKSLAAGATLAALPLLNAMEFDLSDPKGVNNIVFLLDAPLESINGTATGISGTLAYDPSSPKSTTGKIVVAVDSLSVPNGKMKEHMMGGKWLDQSQYPEITFELASLSDVKKDGDKVSATAHGTMTIKGKSKEMAVPVSLTYLPGMMQQRQGQEGDIVVVRSEFSVSRSDFGVNAGENEEKVSDEVELRLSIAGFAPADS
ncbi:YceI family protein [Pelagicoccus sp. SDUM812003]|uniref:YceI family protein n=1 Tax=Pelagicoccus sp. SDUM812003 TaxID=3041267 RepID=UPI00280D0944|nr:YceI family protein [Pelagicoccus sp. SDUM812003]MDQ8203822.1 YceI family protein [Pelagicoccus sp. SDUM812003]